MISDLTALGYEPKDIALKASLREFKVGKGSKAELYRPDYVLSIDGVPCVVIDAKAPSEKIEKWEHQCSSYCLELNKQFDYNPVQLFVLSNGLKTAVYRWDYKEPLVEVAFDQFTPDDPTYQQLHALLHRKAVKTSATKLREVLDEMYFPFQRISLSDLIACFQVMHQYIWKKEKKSPSAAFQELIKVIFVKIQKDRDLHHALGGFPKPKYKDVVFSAHWIAGQTENDSPINDPLFRNLVRSLERDIQDGKKKRFFDQDERINLHPDTLLWIVKQIEHIDFFGMEDDIHGRMFESFLEATVRGKDLGQFFTPRDIVNLMVSLASIQVTKTHVDRILDACCGSGGFLISAMNDMQQRVDALAGISNLQRTTLRNNIQDSVQ